MTITCRKCAKPARQEATRPDHLGFDGVAWRAYCHEHLAQQVAKYDLLIRQVGQRQGTKR